MWYFRSNNNKPDCHRPADCMLQQSPEMLTLRKNRKTTFIIHLASHQPPGLHDRHVFTCSWRQAVALILALMVILVLLYYVFHFLPVFPYIYTLIRVFYQSHLTYVLFVFLLKRGDF